MTCCEEMSELVKSTATKNDLVKVYLENEVLDELVIPNSGVNNIIFRYCPYCGKVNSQSFCKKTIRNVVDEIKTILENKDVQNFNVSQTVRVAVLEEAVSCISNVIYKGKK